MDLSPEQFEDLCTRVEEYAKQKLKREVDSTVEGIISVFRKVFVKSRKTAPRSQPPSGITNGENSNDVPLATELSAHVNSESSVLNDHSSNNDGEQIAQSVSQCTKQKQTIETELDTSVCGDSASGSQHNSDEGRHDDAGTQERATNSAVTQLEPYPDDDTSDDEAHTTIDGVSTLDIEQILNVTFAQSSTPFELDIQTPRLPTKRKADFILSDDAGQSKRQANILLNEVEDNVTGQENGTDPSSFENVSLINRENIDNDTYEQDQDESQEQSSNANLNNTSRRSLKRSLKEEIQTPKLPPKKQKADSNVAGQSSELNNSCNEQRKSLKRAKPNSPPMSQPVNNEMPKSKMPKPNGPDSSANAESKQTGKWQENQFYLNIISMKCFMDYCHAQFSSKFDHDKHMKEEHYCSPVLCPLLGCSVSVLNKVQWMNHVKSFHRSVNRWVCGGCSQVWPTSHELYFHNLHDHQEGIFQCAQLGCRFLATTRGPVFEHYQRAHIRNLSPPHYNFHEDGSNLGKDGHPIYKYRTISTLCPEENCREVLITKDEYDRHLKEAHEVLLFRCLHKNCNQSFNRRRGLDEHIRVAHSNVRVWKCFQCMQSFKDHSCLHSHVYYSHYFGHFKCLVPECNFFSEHRADVAIHYRKMHRNNGPPRALTPMPMPHQQHYFEDMPSLDFNHSEYPYAQDEPYVPRCGMGPEQQFGDFDQRRNSLLLAPLPLPPPMFNGPTFENQPYFIDSHDEQYSDFY